MSEGGLEVSVVLAVRNDEVGIERAVRSILEQKGVDLELIAVDDGSRDSTPKRLRQLSASDSRVRVLHQAAEGLTVALSRGCAAARGRIIARQDSGDLSLPGRLARQAAVFRQNSGVVLVSCATRCEAPGGEELYVRRSERVGEPTELGGPGDTGPGSAGPTAHGSVVFRRRVYEKVGGYRLPFRFAQDWDLWLRLGEWGKYYECSEELYVQRLSVSSISFAARPAQQTFGRLAARAREARAAFGDDSAVLREAEKLSILCEEAPSSTARSRALASYHFGEALRRRGSPGARRYLEEALGSNPLLLRARIRLLQLRMASRSESG